MTSAHADTTARNPRRRALFRAAPLLAFLLALAPASASADSPPPVPPDKPAPVSERAATIALQATIPPAETKTAPTAIVAIEQTVAVDARGAVAAARVTGNVVQGSLPRLLFALSGGRVEKVSGAQIADWWLRDARDGKKFVEARFKTPLKKGDIIALDIEFARQEAGRSGLVSVPVLFNAAAEAEAGAPAPVVISGGAVSVSAGGGVRARVRAADGLLPLDANAPAAADGKTLLFRHTPAKDAALRLEIERSGETVSLEDFSLKGRLSPDGSNLAFTLEAVARVSAAGAALPILSREAALSAFPDDAGFRVRVDGATGAEARNYSLVFDKAGRFPVKLSFDARVERDANGKSSANFSIPAAPVSPLALEGFPPDIRLSLAGADSVAPAPVRGGDGSFRGFLPPDGSVALSWERETAKPDTAARLFFSTSEVSEITLRPGLLRQTSRFQFQILQGRADTLSFALDGEGEIFRVSGDDVLSWKIEPAKDAAGGEQKAKSAAPPKTPPPARVLTVRLASPKSGGYALTLDAQTPLGDFPLKTGPLAITPLGGLRHSGFVRVGNEGAVRVEPFPGSGLTQVAPELFPDGARATPGRRFVYRIAGAGAKMQILADNILPETSVSLVTLYRVAESDFFMDVELELDVREAPLPELSMTIPDGFSITQTAQLDEWTHALGGAAGKGRREARLIFAKPVQGRCLVRFLLEKTRPAGDGAWTLEPLAFPAAKSVRGHAGVVADAGLRVSYLGGEGVVEIAPAFFPKKTEGLQHAFRLRDAAWSARMRVEKLGVAVQSDGLHLFAVREGLVGASTIINYIITGAPAGDFRFAVPPDARNLEFAGKDIRAWKRDGGDVVVSLLKPVSGAFTLLGTYDLPLDPRGGSANFAGLRPLGVNSEQGFVLVTSNIQFDARREAVSENLTPVEPGEIPAEYRMMFDAPLLDAFQYAGRPFELKLNLVPRPRGETVNQIVDFASLQTRVSGDGQILTEASYLVKSHGRPHLRVSTPPGLKLWTARVDKADVLPVMDKDATLIPLPSRDNASAILTVDLRFAGTAGDAGKIRLAAPLVSAPVINTRWTVTPDKSRRLAFAKGNLSPLNTASSGADAGAKPDLDFLPFLLVCAIGFFAALGLFLAEKIRRAKHPIVAGATAGISILVAIFSLFSFGVGAFLTLSPEQTGGGALEFATPVRPPDSALFLELSNRAADAGWTTPAFWAFLLAGAVLGVRALVKKSPLLRAAVWGVLASAGILSAATVIGWLCAVSALFIALEIIPPGLRGFFRAKKPAVAASLLLAFMLAAAPPAGADDPAPPPPAAEARAKPADSVSQQITVSEKRTFAAAVMRVSGAAGDRFDLLAPPAVLTECSPPKGARLVKTRLGNEYAAQTCATQIVLETDGAFSVAFKYELPGGLGAGSLRLPTSVAVHDAASLALEEKALAVSSAAAASVRREEEANFTRAALTFLPGDIREIRWAPKARDRRSEPLVAYVESADLYIPSPGVLDGRHLVKIRPAQGLLGNVELLVPSGFSVAGVGGRRISQWRFDPARRVLSVNFESGQEGETTLLVETQTGLGALPQKQLLLSPLRALGAAGQVGLLGVSTGDDVRVISAEPARAEKKDEKAAAMQPVSNNDFPHAQLFPPPNATPRPYAGPGANTLRRAFRYGDAAAAITAHIDAVEPEVRVEAAQRVSLGEERVGLNVRWTVDITRAGVFRLSFALPEPLEVESISGDALSHWTETRGDGGRVVVMHLREKTLGRRQFTLDFSSPGLGGKKRWSAPRVVLREATRQTGDLVLAPEEGLRPHIAARSGATQFDPAASETGGASRRPRGMLAFHIQQRDWKLDFDIENLAPWIQCDHLQDITIRDGRVRGLVNFEYTIENAAAKSLRVRLPANAESVRFTGALVADASPDPAEAGLWEVRLQRRVIGKTTVQASFQRAAAGGDAPALSGVSAVDAGLQHGWLALRAAGRLEIKPGALPAALVPSDWRSVPASLRRGLAEPSAVLRMVEAREQFSLPVDIVAHDPAKLLALRVEKAALQTLLSDDGGMLTRVTLTARLAEKGVLRATLPAGATYWHGFVNDEPVRVARDKDVLLFPVSPNPKAGQPVSIEFYYAAPTAGGKPAGHKLDGPRFDVPLENITWRILLPAGFKLEKHAGDLRLVEPAAVNYGRSGSALMSSVDDYLKVNSSILSEKSEQAHSLIKLGHELQTKGVQDQAVQALSLAQNLSISNTALNEDARVKLNSLRAEQIEVGMNRWKQNLKVQNSTLAFPNAQGAKEAPPNTQTGNYTNYTPAEVQAQRQQNTFEENTVTRHMAERFLSQQLTITGSMDSIRPLFPEGGKELLFERTLQVGRASDLSLQLFLADTTPKPASRIPAALVAALLTLLAALVLPRLVNRP
jgi:hypothetical protein